MHLYFHFVNHQEWVNIYKCDSMMSHSSIEFMSLLSLYMNQEDKKNHNNWTSEERDRIVGAFQWLLDQDKKQNPHLYTKKATLEKGRLKSQKESK